MKLKIIFKNIRTLWDKLKFYNRYLSSEFINYLKKLEKGLVPLPLIDSNAEYALYRAMKDCRDYNVNDFRELLGEAIDLSKEYPYEYGEIVFAMARAKTLNYRNMAISGLLRSIMIISLYNVFSLSFAVEKYSKLEEYKPR